MNKFLTIVSIALSALLAYGFYSCCSAENQFILTLGSFVSFATTLIMALGLNYETERSTTNIRALSLFFFIVFLGSNLLSAYLDISRPVYIITIGVIICVFLMSFYGIKKANQ